MKIKDIPSLERPRERAMDIGLENLSNEDLLAILLGSGTSSCSVKEVALKLLSKLQTLSSLQDEIPSEGTELEFKDSVILENLEMGTLYGLYLPDNNDTGLRGLNRVSPHFYCFVANEESREFKFSDFDFFSSTGTFKAVKMPLSNAMEVSKNEVKIRYENEQGLFYLFCIPIEISDIEGDYPVLYENFVNLDANLTNIRKPT